MKQKRIDTNGVTLNVVEQGDGPVVLFVHGFPDGWRGWRRQMAAVSAAGYRAISLDMRGYGGSSKPESAESYTVFRCVGDLVGLLSELGIPKAVLVGHDFGAVASWSAAMMRPDLFSAIFCLSVPPVVPESHDTIELMKAASKDEFYISRLVRIESDQEWADAKTTIPGMLYWTSGLPDRSEAWDPMNPMKGLNRPSPVGIPAFANQDDVHAAIADFQRDGFHEPLNYFRALQPYIAEAGAFANATIPQPSFFAFGTEDGMVRKRALQEDDLASVATDLRGFLPIEGVGHWPQLEASGIVNDALLGFLSSLQCSGARDREG